MKQVQVFTSRGITVLVITESSTRPDHAGCEGGGGEYDYSSFQHELTGH